MEKKINKHFKVELEIEIRDKNGKLIRRHKQECKSWTINFPKALFGLFHAPDVSANIIQLTDTAGTARPYPYLGVGADNILQVNAPANIDAWGIQVGTGTTPPNPGDYMLTAKITHGTGSGQMIYGASTVEGPWQSDFTISWRLTRAFTNNSGATITVAECGIAIQWRDFSSAYYALIIHDLISPAQDVPNGASITIRYLFSFTP